jgi:TRAP-type C4-dicarboxylate transport system substrate-binding protein
MRQHRDESEHSAREAVRAAGVALNEVDMPAFRHAARPLLDEYLQRPEIAALHRRIRALS